MARRGAAVVEDREDYEEYEADEYVEEGPPPWIPWAAFLLSLVGLGISTYLTVEHFSGGLLPCPANSVISCLKVTTSPESEVFGVLPVAVLGLAYFVVYTAINIPPLWKTADVRVAWARLAVSIIGIGMVIYLLSAELFSIKAICLWCTGVHIITFLLFVLVMASFPAILNRSRQWEAGAEA